MPTTTGDSALKPEGPQYVCHACISDKFLAKQVEKEGTREECTYCRATNTAFTLADLSNRIHRVLEEHFIPVSECDVPEQFRQGWDDAETVIEEVAGIEQGIAADVRENLFKRLAQTENVAGGEENPYNHRMLYVEHEADASDLRSAWWHSKEEIRSRARFFGATTAATLERIFEDLASLRAIWGKPVVREIKPGDKDSSFWRARTAHSESEIQSILESLSSQLGPPPSDRATAGRMNAEGIPVFYGALEEETCVSEVRAPVGSFVVLVKFDLLSPINVLDLEALSNPESEFSHFDPDYIEKRSRERFLKELVGEMSRPVMPHEEAREYIATQIVSEYLANRVEPRLHGIIFSSAQTEKGGRNVVLFSARSVEADEPGPGLRVRIPPRPGIPQLGTESSKDSTIQTEPQGATAETERSVEDPTTVDPETQGNHGDSILRLAPQSLKVLAISGVKYESTSLPVNRDYKVSAGTVRFHFDVPTAKVTVSRRNQDQDQETGQQPAEVEPKLQTSS